MNFVHARAEDFGQDSKYREKFDIVTARAVARLSVLAELCVPLVKKGGIFISMKGAAAEDELNRCKKSTFCSRGYKLKKNIHLNYQLKIVNEISLFLIKIKITPKKYPRKPGIPNKTANSVKLFHVEQ